MIGLQVEPRATFQSGLTCRIDTLWIDDERRVVTTTALVHESGLDELDDQPPTADLVTLSGNAVCHFPEFRGRDADWISGDTVLQKPAKYVISPVSRYAGFGEHRGKNVVVPLAAVRSAERATKPLSQPGTVSQFRGIDPKALNFTQTHVAQRPLAMCCRNSIGYELKLLVAQGYIVLIRNTDFAVVIAVKLDRDLSKDG